MAKRPNLKLWVTYSWADREEGDFQYLVQELRPIDITATYDKVALVPGQRLWDQIGSRITKDPIDGWAYLLTPNSLSSEPCREELAIALDRALRSKGKSFPLIGLLHDVSIDDVPPALKVRLCVNLKSKDWREEVRAGLEGRPPSLSEAPQTEYVWQVHIGYRGNPSVTAVEVRPRFGELMYWRFGVPAANPVARWGHGPSGGGEISPMQLAVVEGGTGDFGGTPVVWFGSGDRLSAGISAYVVFNGPPPAFMGFCKVGGQMDPPGTMEVVSLG